MEFKPIANRKPLPLSFWGWDSSDRPVYKTEDGTLFVDIDPRSDRKPELCTKCLNRFDGEPDCSIGADYEPIFSPERYTW